MTDWPGQPVATQWPGTPKTSEPEKPQERGPLDMLFGTTGPRYQTFPERAVRDVLGSMKSAVDASKQYPPGSREASAAVAGPAIEAAAALSPASPAMKMAGPAVKEAVREAPSTMQLFEAASKSREALKQTGLELKPEALTNLQNFLRDYLHEKDFRDYLAPDTFRVIKELEALPGKNATLADLRGVYGRLGNVDPSKQKDYAAAQMVREKLKAYLMDVPKSDVVKGDSEEVGHLLRRHNADYAAAKRSEKIEKITNEATEFSSDAYKDAKKKVKKLLNSPKDLRGFSDAEVEELKKFYHGEPVRNLAHLISSLSLYHPITGWGPAILGGALTGNPALGAASLGIGNMAKRVSDKKTISRLKEIEDMIRKRSAAGETFVPQEPAKPPVSSVMASPLLSAGARAPIAAGPRNDIQSYLDSI